MSDASRLAGGGDKQFPCAGCGAQLAYAPGTAGLACPYCGRQNPIPRSEKDIPELDLDEFLKPAAATAAKPETRTLKCAGCGAELTVPSDRATAECAYCGLEVVTPGGSSGALKPQALVPFAVPRAKALALFQNWIRGLWFAPSDLKRRALVDGKLTGLYVPCYTYDAKTVSFYRGERGDAYYVEELRALREGGRDVQRRERVRHLRWTEVEGSVWLAFDDILVPATRSLAQAETAQLAPWDLQSLTPFQEAFLSGFVAEVKQVEPAAGFELAKAIMEPRIAAAVRADIGGDEQRVHAVKTGYRDLSFKHVLLPLWISAYRYRDKVYRYLVNGQSGKVHGKRPWSWMKIAAAVLAGAILIGLGALIASR